MLTSVAARSALAFAVLQAGQLSASLAIAASYFSFAPFPPTPPIPPTPPTAPGGRGRILRIRVTEDGEQKVNVAIPLAIARVGKMKLASSGLVRGHLGKFGIDLDELLRSVDFPGKIVDIADDEDRVEIFVE